jgi:hypothetical protein
MFSYGNERSNISNWKLVLAGDISYTAENRYAELFAPAVSACNSILVFHCILCFEAIILICTNNSLIISFIPVDLFLVTYL